MSGRVFEEPFDAAFYLEANPDVRQAGLDPHWHYLAHGRAEGRTPNPVYGACDRQSASPRVPGWFDGRWYFGANADVQVAGFDPVDHYLNYGHHEGRPPNRALARLRSLKFRPPLAPTSVERTVLTGVVVRSGVFDPEWYAARYDVPVLEAPMHYVAVGAFLGHDPNPVFSSLDYFAANPDLAKAGLNPLVHHIEHGSRERRQGGLRLDLTARVWQHGF